MGESSKFSKSWNLETHNLQDANKIELERAVHGAPLQIPTLKFLTPPVPPGGHEPGNRMTIDPFPIIGFYLYHVISADQSNNWTTSGIWSCNNLLLILHAFHNG